jgi:hypothetical protein
MSSISRAAPSRSSYFNGTAQTSPTGLAGSLGGSATMQINGGGSSAYNYNPALVYSHEDGEYYMKSTQVMAAEPKMDTYRVRYTTPLSLSAAASVATPSTVTEAKVAHVSLSQKYLVEEMPLEKKLEDHDFEYQRKAKKLQEKKADLERRKAALEAEEMALLEEEEELKRNHADIRDHILTALDKARAVGDTSSPISQYSQRHGMSNVASTGNLRVETVLMAGEHFDLSTILPQILNYLGCSSNASVYVLDNPGGRNEGIWSLQDGNKRLVLKLLSSRRVRPHILTDAEKFLELARIRPSITSDHSLSFPTTIFKCCGTSGDELYDLIVMPEALGSRLADVVALKKATRQAAQLLTTMRSFGEFLADFHSAYQMQHGDCHCSNVFFDELSGLFTMIDVADMGTDPYRGEEDDVTYFNKALMTLEQYHGFEFLTSCCNSMTEGYKERIAVLSPGR